MAAKIKKPVGHNYNPLKHKPRGVDPRAFHQVYWPYLPLLLVVAVAAALAFSPGAFKKLVKPDGQVLSYATEMSRQSLLNNTNNLRAEDNLADFRLSKRLDKAAQAKANDMVKRNYWSHNTPDGRSPWTFVTAQHYSFRKLGENLAAGFPDSDSVVKAWLASPSHRQNLLDPKYIDVGFGFANSGNYTSAGGGEMTVVVALYGQPVGNNKVAAVANTSGQPPATTDSSTDSSSLESRTSRAALIFAKTPIRSIATSLVAVTMLAAVLFWAGRHFVALRRAWVKSERFVIKHPALDIFLLAVIVLSYILSQTAGFIQ